MTAHSVEAIHYSAMNLTVMASDMMCFVICIF